MFKIVVFNPNIILGDSETNFHGYAEAFVRKYADYVYVLNPKKRRLIKEKIKEISKEKEIKVVANPLTFMFEDVVIVGFGARYKSTQGIQFIKGKKIFHLLDYYIDIPEIKKFLKKVKCDVVIEHGQLDKHSEFYMKYYSEYIGKTISLPFGYGARFRYYKPFEHRRKKAVGLGSINKIADKMLNVNQISELIEFYRGREYQHEVRAYLRDHAYDFLDCIDSKFPTDANPKGRDYDAVKVLNDYQMFINDEGFSGFLPARTYEGIACGAVMVAPINDLYSEMGFVPGLNYIGYEEGNYTDLKSKIQYYIQNQNELIQIQIASLKLAGNYTHEKVADMLYENICRVV